MVCILTYALPLEPASFTVTYHIISHEDHFSKAEFLLAYAPQ